MEFWNIGSENLTAYPELDSGSGFLGSLRVRSKEDTENRREKKPLMHE